MQKTEMLINSEKEKEEEIIIMQLLKVFFL